MLPAQVLRDYLQGKLPVSAKADAQLARLAALQHLSKANRNTPSEQDLLAYVPQQLQRQVNMASIKNLMGQELRQLGGHSPQEAQISFIGGSGAGTAGVGAGGQEGRNAGRGARRGLHLPCPSQLT